MQVLVYRDWGDGWRGLCEEVQSPERDKLGAHGGDSQVMRPTW